MSTNEQIKNTLVNAIEDAGLGYARSQYGADRAIDAATESLAAALSSSVQSVLDRVRDIRPDLVEEAHDLFVEVGLLTEDEPEPEVEDNSDAIAEVQTLLAQVKDILAKIGVTV